MSNILAIDTSTVAASVAVMKDGSILGEEYTAYKLKHSEKLLPLVSHLLEDLRMDIKDIDYFAVGEGPGSFTGLRIAAATVKAFAHVYGKDIVSVSSLHACAKNLEKSSDAICVLFDAQRQDAYFNLFLEENGELVPQYDDMIIHMEDLPDMLDDFDYVLFAGDGVKKYREFLVENLGERAEFADDYNMLPKGSGVAKVAEKYIEEGKNIFDYDNFLPNYIRPSAAEEQRNKK